MKLSLIAAVGKNYELGKNGDLIWCFPEDMKFFKDVTMGHKMVMGRKTFDSLPHLLPGRQHIVLTKKELEFPKEVEVFKNIDDFLNAYKDFDEEIFDIGGASLYAELIDYADNIYLTEILSEAPADVYFPQFDKSKFDRLELGQHAHDDITFKHVLYKRSKK